MCWRAAHRRIAIGARRAAVRGCAKAGRRAECRQAGSGFAGVPTRLVELDHHALVVADADRLGEVGEHGLEHFFGFRPERGWN